MPNTQRKVTIRVAAPKRLQRVRRGANGGGRKQRPAQQRAPRVFNFRRSKSAPLSTGMPMMTQQLKATGAGDELVLSFTELMMVATIPDAATPPQSVSFWPGASGMTRLDQFAQLYDQYQVLSCELIHRSAVSATTNGMAILAVDYNAVDLPLTLVQTEAVVPRWSDKIWANGYLNLDCTKLMKSRWHNTSGTSVAPGFGAAFAALFHATGTNGTIVGDVWCRYKVKFSGPSTGSMMYVGGTGARQQSITIVDQASNVIPTLAGTSTSVGVFGANVVTKTVLPGSGQPLVQWGLENSSYINGFDQDAYVELETEVYIAGGGHDPAPVFTVSPAGYNSNTAGPATTSIAPYTHSDGSYTLMTHTVDKMSNLINGALYQLAGDFVTGAQFIVQCQIRRQALRFINAFDTALVTRRQDGTIAFKGVEIGAPKKPFSQFEHLVDKLTTLSIEPPKSELDKSDGDSDDESVIVLHKTSKQHRR